MSKDQTITIKLVKSGIGRMKNHKLCIKGLGFKKLMALYKNLRVLCKNLGGYRLWENITG